MLNNEKIADILYHMKYCFLRSEEEMKSAIKHEKNFNYEDAYKELSKVYVTLSFLIKNDIIKFENLLKDDGVNVPDPVGYKN